MTKTTRRRNTFTKFAGSTFPCNVCGRLTRHTGVQGIGCQLCPQCFDLAGIENELSDGYCPPSERRDDVERLTAEVKAKGGDLENWLGLLEQVAVGGQGA